MSVINLMSDTQTRPAEGMRRAIAHADVGGAVRDGNVITGGRVAAGIDFAVPFIAELSGADVSQSTQLRSEYAPLGRLGQDYPKWLRRPSRLPPSRTSQPGCPKFEGGLLSLLTQDGNKGRPSASRFTNLPSQSLRKERKAQQYDHT